MGYGGTLVVQAIVGGSWQQNRGRHILAALGIALGVSLATAVRLINLGAVDEFEQATRMLSGEADIVVRGSASGFDEAAYPLIARLPEVAAASPRIEIDLVLAGRRTPLRLLAIDPLRALQIQPDLLAGQRGTAGQLLESDAMLLSAAAAAELGLAVDDRVTAQVGSSTETFRVVGILPSGSFRQKLAIVDIATAQWRLDLPEKLTGVDIRLRPGADRHAFLQHVQTLLPSGAHASTPDIEAGRSREPSRPYRLNLDMLAMMALLTGAFLVFSTQFLAVLRRRRQFALLRALGLTRHQLMALVLLEGAIVGAVGALGGIVVGSIAAAYALAHFGADLGAGYFSAVIPTLRLDPVTLLILFSLGVLMSVLGAVIPARDIARRAPAAGLRARDEDQEPLNLNLPLSAVVLICGGLLLSLAPPWHGLPVAGYASIAAILLGSVQLIPRMARFLLARMPVPRNVPAALAINQFQAIPQQIAIGIAAIVVSFSLLVAMLIMTVSFRNSLDTWLTHMLPADLHVRAATGGDTASFSPAEQQRIAATPGVKQAQFLRSRTLLLDPAWPALTLHARPISAETAAGILPLRTVTPLTLHDTRPPLWISEVARDLLGVNSGDRLTLPLSGQNIEFTIAGVWRDYGRQNGALVMNRDDYVRITDDRAATDAALWLAPGTSVETASTTLRQNLAHVPGLMVSATATLRELSLRLFDRTFALTYGMQWAAIVIGLFAVSTAFSARAIARRREYGVLRHLGLRRRDIGLMLAWEGLVMTSIGIGAGLLTGGLISLILIHVINPQSFHWSIDLHIPWMELSGITLLLTAACTLAAVAGGRSAMSMSAARAVRNDW